MQKNSPISLMQMVLLAGLCAVTVIGFVKIPESAAVPIHWNVNGIADAFWPRNYALMVLPVIAFAMLCLNLVAGRRRGAQNGRHVARAAITASLVICLAIQSGVVMTALGRNIEMLQLVRSSIDRKDDEVDPRWCIAARELSHALAVVGRVEEGIEILDPAIELARKTLALIIRRSASG